MMSYEPVPLLEASLFLANRECGATAESFFSDKAASIDPADGRTERYIEIIKELEARLEGSISVEDSVLSALFKPLEAIPQKQALPSVLFAANLIVQDISNYHDMDRCFDSLRMREPFFKSSAANWIGSPKRYDTAELTTDELITVLHESGLSADAKLAILDIAVNYGRYVDMLEATLRPVAEEFLRCRELIAPLIGQFKADVSDASVISDTLENGDVKPDNIIVFPIVTYFNHRIVNFTGADDSRKAYAYVGVLFDFLKKNYMPNLCDNDKIATIMNVLGNKNRFSIMAKLSEGPVYGREIANMLSITPATVSQHMTLLMGAGLVKLENEGAKVYYSINREGMESFIKMQSRLFLKD